MKKEEKKMKPSIRQKAENLARMRSSKVSADMAVYDMHQLLQELEIHQIELELQNEELYLAKERTDISVERFTELYDFAPVGYFTLLNNGEIIEVNLFGLQLFGRERSRLLSGRFGFFVSDGTKPIFNQFLENIFSEKPKETCEVILVTEKNNQLFVQLNGILSANKDHCLVTVTDITSLKRREESLLAKEREHRNNFIFLHSILESPNNIIICSLDKDYCYIAFTKFYEQMVKNFQGVDIYIGMNILENMPYQEDKAIARKNFDRALSGEYFIMDEEYMHETLSSNYYENYYSPLKDSDGNIVGLSVFIIDITKRKNAEQKVLRLDTIYSVRSEINKLIVVAQEPSVLFEGICQIAVEYGQFRMAWIGIIDELNGLIVPKYSAGKEKDYLKGLRISSQNDKFGCGPSGTSTREGRCVICNDISVDEKMQPWREIALKSGFFASASIPIRCNGVAIGTFAIYSEKPHEFGQDSESLLNEIGNDLSFALDAMEAGKRRKQVEELLKVSEEKYRTVFATDTNALFLIEKESYNILDVNDAVCSLFGYPRDEIIRMKITELSAEPEKTKRSIAENQTRVELRYYRKKDGSVFPTDISTTQFLLVNKMVIFASVRDITERESKNLEIKYKTEELQKINSEKDKFFSIISHDLRAPFNGFLGLTEILSEEASQLSPGEIHSLARMLNDSAKNLYSLLGNLLEWSQMQRGLVTFAPESFLLSGKITGSISNILDSARKKEIDVIINIQPGLCVIADARMFESTIRNLCSNALKFTHKGGHVTIKAYSVSNILAEVSIQDDGIGMTQEMISNLFSLTKMTNRKGTDNEPSSGLGLILCRDFIVKHGSELHIESEPGVGTTFRFELPAGTR